MPFVSVKEMLIVNPISVKISKNPFNWSLYTTELIDRINWQNANRIKKKPWQIRIRWKTYTNNINYIRILTKPKKKETEQYVSTT